MPPDRLSREARRAPGNSSSTFGRLLAAELQARGTRTGTDALTYFYQVRCLTMSTEADWPPDIDKLTQEIIATAKEPVILSECFAEWLRTYWMDNSEGEARHLWRESARTGFWVCTQYLRCIDEVLANPPEDLVELMRVDGWIGLYDRSVTPWRLLGQEEYLAWLRNVRVEFEDIVDEMTRDLRR
jgi:hypothetical protein